MPLVQIRLTNGLKVCCVSIHAITAGMLTPEPTGGVVWNASCRQRPSSWVQTCITRESMRTVPPPSLRTATSSCRPVMSAVLPSTRTVSSERSICR